MGVRRGLLASGALLLVAACGLGAGDEAESGTDNTAATRNCDAVFEQSLALSGEDAPTHTLRVVLDGENCLDAFARWEMVAPGGAVIWKRDTDDHRFGDPYTGEKPATDADVVRYYAGRLAVQDLDNLAQFPAWAGNERDFEFVGPDGLDGYTAIGEEAWEKARADARPAWCYVPSSHGAACYWLGADGTLEEAYEKYW